jgi:SIR2-like domain
MATDASRSNPKRARRDRAAAAGGSGMSNAFPDQIHLEQVRRHLWSPREGGRAAVMVGAGFSRQAQPTTPSAPLLPLWLDVAMQLDAKLNPGGGSHEFTTFSGPRLASQYEVVFGRSALDALLLELIPDQQYAPGLLHQRLLTLPWSDVFTTNYDTLLERALPRVHDRKYDLLLAAPDIPGRVQPRIVKLHGSFPSQRPFIITEEDYRQYPARFAPFVNMVQQSLMENIFCLIGFSGDDPNFLYWTGWVRDNLGESTPLIYLCGLLDLSHGSRQLLLSRKVVPIDLSPIVPRDSWPDPHQRHAVALEWLLEFFAAGKPPNRLGWPASAARSRPPVRSGLPAIPAQDEAPPDAVPAAPGPLSADGANALRERWRDSRLRYPGWEVAPYRSRVLLWHNTNRHVEQLLHALEHLAPVERLRTLFELVWRLDTALVPLFLDWLPPMIATLEAINPRPGSLELPLASVSPIVPDHAGLDWVESTMMWIEVAFSIAREARDDLDSERFNLWMNRLRAIVDERADWHARWAHERCLFFLLRLDHDAVRTAMVDWPAHASPFWETKRAAVLAEIGQIEDAERAAQDALNDIRARQVAVAHDLTLLSQEGWTMTLLRSIRLNHISIADSRDEERDRWDTLSSHRCNPRDDLELHAALVARPVTAPKPVREKIRQFDPGIWSTTYHLGSRVDEDSILAGFSFLRMLENGALPLRCGLVAMSPDEVIAAADWIQEDAPFWSLGARLRTGDHKAIERFFDRSLVATLDQSRFDFLFSVATTSLSQALVRLSSTPGGAGFPNSTLVSLFSELLSRLSVRALDGQLVETLNLAISMYRMPIIRAHPFHESLRHLFERVIYALSPSTLLARIPEVLALPIPDVDGCDVPDAETWPEPFAMNGWPQTLSGQTLERGSLAALITWLLGVVSTGTPPARRRAVIRLLQVFRMNLLSDSEQVEFGAALWSKVDPHGLPADSGLLPGAYLALPAPETVDVQERIRAYLNARDFRRLIHRGATSATSRFDFVAGTDNYVVGLLRVTKVPWVLGESEKDRLLDWSPEEAAALLEKAAVWWEHHKSELTSERRFPDSAEKIKEDTTALLNVLAVVVLPRLSPKDRVSRERAAHLVGEIQDAGVSTLLVTPLTIRLGVSPDEVAKALRHGLLSSQEPVATAAASGIGIWIVGHPAGLLPAPNSYLVDDMVHVVAARRSPALMPTLTQLASIVRSLPGVITAERLELLSLGLEELAKETALPSSPSIVGDGNTPLMPKDRPAHRRAAVELAAAISGLPGSSAGKPRIVVDTWRRIAETDVLPEVRRGWSG